MAANGKDGIGIGARAPIVAGALAVAGFFGGFGVWAAMAPLDSAAIAPGQVKVESYRKTVQHREGGIVRRILVGNGSYVTAGQPLVLLDDTAIRAQHEQLRNQLWDAQATRARLLAERDGQAEIDFGPLADNKDQPRVAELMRAAENLFRARRDLLDGQVAVLRKQIVQYEREAEAREVEQRSKQRQLALIADEVETVTELVRKGLGVKPRLLALQREQARLEGERDDLAAQVAKVRQGIAATELEIANITFQQLNQIAADLADQEGRLRDLEQQLTAVEDQLQRTIIRSPQDGYVVDLKVHTVGAVLSPGDALMDVVPRNDTLLVEARVKPEDIDRVHANRTAQVRFRTFLRGLTPPALGTVTAVSADLLLDERTGEGYYLARVRLDPESLKRLPGPLTPGMQADVLIATGERTALEYMISPLTQAMSLAMREK